MVLHAPIGASTALCAAASLLSKACLAGRSAVQSSHKLQVVVVCEEALPRITYSARTVDVGPLTEHLATEMVKEAQPDVSEVSDRVLCLPQVFMCGLLRAGVQHCAQLR